jgi:hypothetical protein
MGPARCGFFGPAYVKAAFSAKFGPNSQKFSGKQWKLRKNTPHALKIHCGFIALGNDVGELLSRKWKEEGLSLDELSRGLANDTITRRRALAVVAASVVGAMIPFARAEAACGRGGHPCEGNQDCCPNFVCSNRGPGTAKRCRRRRDDD